MIFDTDAAKVTLSGSIVLFFKIQTRRDCQASLLIKTHVCLQSDAAAVFTASRTHCVKVHASWSQWDKIMLALARIFFLVNTFYWPQRISPSVQFPTSTLLSNEARSLSASWKACRDELVARGKKCWRCPRGTGRMPEPPVPPDRWDSQQA